MDHWSRTENLIENISNSFTSRPIRCKAYSKYFVNFSWSNLTLDSYFVVEILASNEHENGIWVEVRKAYLHGANGVNFCEGLICGTWIRLKVNQLNCVLTAQLVLKN
jgi:hypothetical protein